MKSTLDYLNSAKKALGIESDYALAKWLGVTKQAVSSYKLGKSIIDDYAAAKIAEALNINALEVIAVANMEREKVSEKREFWRKIAVGSAALGIAILLADQSVIPNNYDGVMTEKYTLCAISKRGSAARLETDLIIIVIIIVVIQFLQKNHLKPTKRLCIIA